MTTSYKFLKQMSAVEVIHGLCFFYVIDRKVYQIFVCCILLFLDQQQTNWFVSFQNPLLIYKTI